MDTKLLNQIYSTASVAATERKAAVAEKKVAMAEKARKKRKWARDTSKKHHYFILQFHPIIDIFHFKELFLCCFGLFYTVCNFPVPKQQNQNSVMKSGHQVAESDQVQMRINFSESTFMEDEWESPKEEVRGPTRQPGGGAR